MKKLSARLPALVSENDGEANTSTTPGNVIAHASAYQRTTAHRSRGERQVDQHEDQAHRRDDGRVRELPEPDEHCRPTAVTASPRRDAEEEQRRTPRERLLSEEQRLEQRRVGEDGGGPPSAAQFGERDERADDARDGSERGPQRDGPVPEQRPHERGAGPVHEAVRIRVRVAVAEHRHAPGEPAVMPEVVCDVPDVHMVVHAVRRQDDRVREVDAEQHDPRDDENRERDAPAGHVVGRVGQGRYVAHDWYAGPPTSSSSRTGRR